MKKNFISKTLLIRIILLFLGTSIIASTSCGDEFDLHSDEITKQQESYEKYISCDTETFYSTDDSNIRQNQPDRNYGNENWMDIANEYGGTGSGSAWDILIKFNIESLPQDIIVKSALLKLYYFAWKDTNPVGRPLNLYRATSGWEENTVTWNTQPSYAQQPSTNTPVPSSAGVWMKWDVTEDVQGFANGEETNYGWKVTDETYWGKVNIPRPRFRPKEYESSIPYLEINAVVLNKAILIGRITNVDTTSEDFITFKAEFLRFIQISPFQFNRYTLGEEIIVDKSYIGILTTRFAFGIFNSGL